MVLVPDLEDDSLALIQISSPQSQSILLARFQLTA